MDPAESTTTSVLPPAPSQREGEGVWHMLRRLPARLGVAWMVSLGIHLLIVGVIALVAVRAALEPPPPVERYIDFDRAGAEPAGQPEGAPRPATTLVREAPEPARAPTAPPPEAREAPAPLPAPAAALPASPGDAWLAPPALTETPRAAEVAPGAPPAVLPGGEVKFAGLGSSNARSVVYVVDASGPMVSSLPEVIAELDRSVSRLTATQKFGVIVFRRDARTIAETESFMPVLVRATAQAKRELRDWMAGLAPKGRSNPLAGLRAALELKPDAVFLLSRGIERSGGGVWELGLEATLAELERLNPVDARNDRRRVVIKTIQFLDEDPTGTMQRIGERHGLTRRPDGKLEAGYRVISHGGELKSETGGAEGEPPPEPKKKDDGR